MLLSEMTPDQLRREMDKLRDQGQKAFDEKNWSEYQTLMTRWYLAKSYLIQDSVRLEKGRTYRLTEADDTLTVTHRKGVMAWGIRGSDGQEMAVPIAMLADLDPKS
ncbi:MAG: DUF1811 family protein [Thermoflavifilum sp.]|nr:DUF1811 family protein [Thermoflavifilum sp.]MCL6513655.1 YfhH family protein [Alicyclobacillus sp.]